MIYRADINIMPLKELLDPQGKAVHHGLNNLGISEINDVRIGKHIQLNMDADNLDKAKELTEVACKKLLANPVMEYFEFTVHE
ncbi:MAG: phosphoribosylformylglycinamidine synthase subunit PurS [Chitinophagales bacterium]|nr:phosphoribosylformylglycinamidine synthase subunit PurS [Chitinophagales bacterium]